MKLFQSMLLPAAFLFPFLLGAQSFIQDSDGNTKVQTESTPNNDDIGFTISGLSRWVMSANTANIARIDVFGTNESIFLGTGAGQAAQAGSNKNIAIGHSAGTNLSTGAQNTFVGAQAGNANTSGAVNTGIGCNALFSTSTGSFNTAVGYGSLQANTTGSHSTAVGYFALASSTGFDNAALGSSALLSNGTGSSNAAFGRSALNANTTGSSNVAVGKSALLVNTTGFSNTALGINAGDFSQANTSCTFLGANSDVSAASGINNATALGNGATVNASNKIRLGNSAVLVVEGNAAYSVSDGRFKSGVEDNAPGLDFILGLKPVTYHFDYPAFSTFLGESSVDHSVLRERAQKREMGFIAQEIESLCKEQGVDLSNMIHTPESETDNYSVAYGQLVVPLVKAVQEQQNQINALTALVRQLLNNQEQHSDEPLPTLQLWPNPTPDVVQLTVNHVGERATISLFSANGKRLKTMPVSAGRHQVDVREYPNGQYFLQLESPGLPLTLKSMVKAQ